MKTSIGNYLAVSGNVDLLKYYIDCKLHKDESADEYYGTRADLAGDVLTDFVLWKTDKQRWLKEGGVNPYDN